MAITTSRVEVRCVGCNKQWSVTTTLQPDGREETDDDRDTLCPCGYEGLRLHTSRREIDETYNFHRGAIEEHLEALEEVNE